MVPEVSGLIISSSKVTYCCSSVDLYEFPNSWRSCEDLGEEFLSNIYFPQGSPLPAIPRGKVFSPNHNSRPVSVYFKALSGLLSHLFFNLLLLKC